MQVKRSHCTDCGKPLDAAICVESETIIPTPGDITVCIGCGHIMAFDKDLELRNLNDAEIVKVAADERILTAQRLSSHYRQRMKPEP